MKNRLKLSAWFAALILFLAVLNFSCRKKDIFNTSPSASLSFSTNIVKFDTVFTSVGSATQNFTARNPGKQAVNISHIMLQGGSGSYFRLNIDGRATTDFQNHELAAGDSIYIFAEVTINPNAVDIPFIVTDTVLFILNGHTQKVALQAFGRNAHFIKNRVLGCDTIITNDGKPVVLYDTAYVKKGCKLTIEKGVTIYCHPKSILLIGGSIICNGTKDEPVTFRQDRLEHKYDNEPGQWYGIDLLSFSGASSMTHTILQNGTVGLEVDSFIPGSKTTPKMNLNKCIIKNMNSSGLVGFGTNISAVNSLVFSSGLYNFYCDLGGIYNITHCTFETSNNIVANRESSVQLGNTLYKNKDSTPFPQDLNAAFRNSIIWGSLDDETKLNNHKNGNAFNAIFYHCVIKAKKISFDNTNFINKDPLFKNSFNGDYHLDILSPAIDHGATYPPIIVPDDLEDQPRIMPGDTIPDIGSYEFKH
jgi:hypothetical protein